MTEPILPQVKKIVFLMLENRSLDNLLGWLYKDAASGPYPVSPQYFYPSNRLKEYDGLVAGKYSNPDTWGNPFDVIPIPDDIWEKGSAIPYYDPWEALRVTNKNDPRYIWSDWNGVMNQFFGNQNLITELPSCASDTPAMKGFLQDYYSSKMLEWKGHDILWTYTPTQASVINALALQYAVSDRWFCSVPSETNPNRAYSICGTSLGNESNGDFSKCYVHGQCQQYMAPTVFNSLANAGKKLGLYWNDEWDKSGKSYTEYTFPNITGTFTSYKIKDFYAQAIAGTLPDFSYLEPPKWTSASEDGADYHPNSHIYLGEQFLHEVYDAVRNGKNWEETLLIITFDEHGGTYDHVAPNCGVKNPDGIDGIENGFKFDLFGARVPTILVSPFVRPGTVFSAPEGSEYDFDHTSFIATILRWAGVDPKSAGLGERVKHAPTFEGVFADEVVNSETVTTEPCGLTRTAVATSGHVHPAGSAEELKAVLEGVPVVSRRAILRTNTTLDGVKADVARYRQNPEKFEALLGESPGS